MLLPKFAFHRNVTSSFEFALYMTLYIMSSNTGSLVSRSLTSVPVPALSEEA